MNKLEKLILEEYKRTIGLGDFQLPLLFDTPVHIGKNLIKKLDEQRQYIDMFFKIIVGIGKKALHNEEEILVKLLFSESIAGMTKEYHMNLPDCCWTIPILYRTDQSVSGKIYEIQSPGSGWGDIPLLVYIFKQAGYIISDSYCKFADRYIENIITITGKNEPNIYHMTDAASAPVGMKYLLAITSEKLKYWGINKNVIMDKVDYVTAHSAAALITSNYFNEYLKLAVEGKVIFGIPPNLIFDQKSIYLLPFYRLTSDLFSDEIRTLFPFTTLIENDGFFDKNGKFISIKEFANRSKKQRLYYLKYGGPNLCKNWGSRGVHRLDGSDCEKRLNEANNLSKNGEVWLLQEDVSKEDINETSDEIRAIGEHIKLSAFNGICGQLGIRIMARSHFKVHGQSDTKIGLAID